MRCARLCIGLLVVAIVVATLFVWNGNGKAASLLSLAPFLLCPLMCIVPMMFGKNCEDGACHDAKHNPKKHS